MSTGIDLRTESGAGPGDERFRALFEHAPVGVALCEPDGRFSDVNPTFERLLAGTGIDPRTGRLTDLLRQAPDGDSEATAWRDGLAAVRAGTAPVARAELAIAPQGAPPRWLGVTAVRVVLGERAFLLAHLEDATPQRLEQQRLVHLALHDGLTGLANRTQLLERLDTALARTAATGVPAAVLYLDLDGFKQVNDDLGHDAGDALLVAVAQRLSGALRTGDVAGRLGGDEFLVVAGDVADRYGLQEVVRRVEAALSGPLKVRVSIGAVLTRPGETGPEVMRRADEAMYAVKRARRRAAGPGQHPTVDAVQLTLLPDPSVAPDSPPPSDHVIRGDHVIRSAGAPVHGELTVEVAIVGAGGAGLSLVAELDRAASRAGRAVPSVALIDPVTRVGGDRTWCFWDAGRSDLDAAVTRSWTQVALVDRAGRSRTLDLTPLRYVMISSVDFYALAEESVRRLGVVRVTASARTVVDGPDRARVETDAGTVHARWVFDSRPAPLRRPARTAWLQHFRGWTVHLDQPVLDPDQAVLMDFSVVQPGAVQPGAGPGLAFGYVLPTAPDRALVEYTVFSRGRLPDEAYDTALRSYLAARWPRVGVTVDAVEDGAIPMTDAVHLRRAGRRAFQLGMAGGATRGSTGYAFAAMQRQAQTVAGMLLSGAAASGVTTGTAHDVEPVPPPAYPARHRWMDAVLLRALDRDLVNGPDLFVRMFGRNPPARVLWFLDGTTSVAEDLAVMASTPTAAMTRAALEDAAARLRFRLTGVPVRR
jgi:lycopene beta-cyclase